MEYDPEHAELEPRAVVQPLYDLATTIQGRRPMLKRLGGKEWPLRTSAWCWWCCHPFPWEPFPLPILRYPGSSTNCHWLTAFKGWVRSDSTMPQSAVPQQPHQKADWQYVVKGNFCSPQCARAYSWRTSCGGARFTKVNDWITSIATEVFDYCSTTTSSGSGTTTTTDGDWWLRMAPPPEILTVFGGPVSIQEYRSHYKVLHRVIEPPFLPADVYLMTTGRSGNHAQFSQMCDWFVPPTAVDRDRDRDRDRYQSRPHLHPVPVVPEGQGQGEVGMGMEVGGGGQVEDVGRRPIPEYLQPYLMRSQQQHAPWYGNIMHYIGHAASPPGECPPMTGGRNAVGLSFMLAAGGRGRINK